MKIQTGCPNLGPGTLSATFFIIVSVCTFYLYLGVVENIKYKILEYIVRKRTARTPYVMLPFQKLGILITSKEINIDMNIFIYYLLSDDYVLYVLSMVKCPLSSLLCG